MVWRPANRSTDGAGRGEPDLYRAQTSFQAGAVRWHTGLAPLLVSSRRFRIGVTVLLSLELWQDGASGWGVSCAGGWDGPCRGATGRRGRRLPTCL